MIKKYIFIIFMVITVPLLLLINVWQANKCGVLKREINRLQREQVQVIEKNKEEIVGITELLSTDNLENNARKIPGLKKMLPEDIMVIEITGGKGSGH